MLACSLSTVPEGRSLPPTPSHHRGPIEPPGINKPQVRGEYTHIPAANKARES